MICSYEEAIKKWYIIQKFSRNDIFLCQKLIINKKYHAKDSNM